MPFANPVLPEHTAMSFAERCAALPSDGLVSVTPMPVTVEDTIRAGDMQSMTVETTGAESLRSLATVGTTRATRLVQLSYGLNMIADASSGQVCFRPIVHIAVGYDPMRITVAQPFHSGTCSYDVIVAHEQHHVHIYEDFLDTAATSIEQAVSALVSKKIRYAPDVVTATADMQRLLDSEVAAVVSEEMMKVQSLHARLDSGEESARMLGSCNGELRRALSREVVAWGRQDHAVPAS